MPSFSRSHAPIFCAWEITQERSVNDLVRDVYTESPIPLLVVDHGVDWRKNRIVHRYHFCCLGLSVRLPYARECNDHTPVVLGGIIPRVIVQEEDEESLGIPVQ